MRSISRTTVAAALVVVAAALLAGDLSAASPKDKLRQKRAQAAAVLAQVNALDRQFEASVEAWHGARYVLDQTRHQLAVDRRQLRVAERQRRVAVTRLALRVRALYETPDDPTTLGIVLGSSSVSEFLDRLNAANAVASADQRLVAETSAARSRYALAERRTAAVVQRRAIALAQRDRERRRIGAMLAERQRLLASVQSEVTRLQAQEAAYEARLAAAARARVAAEQAAAARRAQEQAAAAKAAAAARARAAKAATTAATTTTATTTAPADPPAPTTTLTAPATTTAPTETSPAAPPAPAAGGHSEAAAIALRYLGVPYVWGGASPAGFDCSGLVMYVYAQLGISLPHYAAAQYTLGTAVSRDQLQPGDLVFFDGLDHVGIYIGAGEFVHAPQTGDVVKITPLSAFGSRYVGARRI